MNFMILNPINSDHVKQISKFSAKIGKELELLEFIKKSQENQAIPDSNNIYEIIAFCTDTVIYNLGLIQGTRDNKLMEFKIFNGSDGANERNRKFLDYLTNYAFQNLNAETIVTFSNHKNKTLELMGYESLGMDNGQFTYVKDRERIEVVGKGKV